MKSEIKATIAVIGAMVVSVLIGQLLWNLYFLWDLSGVVILAVIIVLLLIAMFRKL